MSKVDRQIDRLTDRQMSRKPPGHRNWTQKLSGRCTNIHSKFELRVQI